jgi:hypothetical protein
MSGLFARTSLSVCTPWFHSTVISSWWHTNLGMWEYQFSVVSMPNVSHIIIIKELDWIIIIIIISHFLAISSRSKTIAILSWTLLVFVCQGK